MRKTLAAALRVFWAADLLLRWSFAEAAVLHGGRLESEVLHGRRSRGGHRTSGQDDGFALPQKIFLLPHACRSMYTYKQAVGSPK